MFILGLDRSPTPLRPRYRLAGKARPLGRARLLTSPDSHPYTVFTLQD